MGEAAPKVDSVLIRSYPKAIFLYPSFLTAIICAIIAFVHKDPAGYDRLSGDIFFTVFALNILITAWDFSKTGFIAVILLAIIAILGGALLEMKVDFLSNVLRFVSGIQLRCHPHVYLFFAGLFGFLLLLSFIQSRLDYWEVHGNELLHVTGFVGNVERFPAPNLRFRKELPDVFEYTLLRAGTLVLEPVAGERHPLPNVININSIERRIEQLLSTIDVTLEQPAARPANPSN